MENPPEPTPGSDARDVFGQYSPEAYAKLREDRYEERIVRTIVKRAGGNVKELEALGREVNGDRGLTFELFHMHYPRFPVILAAARIPYVFKIELPELFQKTGKISFVERWLEYKKEQADYCFGLIFDWTDQYPMILHDKHSLEPTGPRALLPLPGRKHFLVLEELTRSVNGKPRGFLESIDQSWVE